MSSFWKETLQILNEAAPYLLAGFLLAGLLDVVLGRYRQLTGLLTSRGRRPVFLAAILGAPLPLCSCSVLPAALTLRRQGASKGTTASFLISVPETDITSITLTYALLGPFMAVARPLAAVVTAITAGLVIDHVDPDKRAAEDAAGGAAGDASRGSAAPAPSDGGTRAAGEATRGARSHWIRRALRFGFIEMFDDIIVQLIAGIVIAGAIVAWLPDLGIEEMAGGSVASYLAMLVLGIPIYVCATASTPLALGFIAGGLSPGAALVFLLVGPATNIASLIVLRRQFGRSALFLYIATLAAGSIAMGVVVDIIHGQSGGAATKALAFASERDGASLPNLATVALLVLVVWSLWRTKQLWKWLGAFGRRRKAAST